MSQMIQVHALRDLLDQVCDVRESVVVVLVRLAFVGGPHANRNMHTDRPFGVFVTTFPSYCVCMVPFF